MFFEELPWGSRVVLEINRGLKNFKFQTEVVLTHKNCAYLARPLVGNKPYTPHENDKVTLVFHTKPVPLKWKIDKCGLETSSKGDLYYVISKEEPARVNMRRELRTPVNLQAKALYRNMHKFPITIDNLSPSGIGFTSPSQLKEGYPIRIFLNIKGEDVEMKAQVINYYERDSSEGSYKYGGVLDLYTIPSGYNQYLRDIQFELHRIPKT